MLQRLFGSRKKLLNMERDFPLLAIRPSTCWSLAAVPRVRPLRGMPPCAGFVWRLSTSRIFGGDIGGIVQTHARGPALSGDGEIALVREGLRERRIWGRIATHLVQPALRFANIRAPHAKQMGDGAGADGI